MAKLNHNLAAKKQVAKRRIAERPAQGATTVRCPDHWWPLKRECAPSELPFGAYFAGRPASALRCRLSFAISCRPR
jgi:hypothetical protein